MILLRSEGTRTARWPSLHYCRCNRLKRFVAMYLLLLAAACGQLVPVETPPQLEYTPGPPVVVTRNTYDAGPFFVEYPVGWRVITPAAFSIPWVVFMTDDQTALVVLALDPDDTDVAPPNTREDALYRVHETVVLNERLSIHALLAIPRTQQEGYIPVFEQILVSLKPQF